MTDVVIRSMVPSEADLVADLLLVANKENLARFPRDVAESYTEELRHFMVKFPSAQVYLAAADARPVGAVTFLPESTQDEHRWPTGGSVIRFLAVDPVWRGQGVGEALTLRCIDRARELQSRFVALHTAPSMAAARRIYERLGFVRSTVHDFHPDDHYGRGADVAVPAWGLAYLLRLE